MKTIHALCSPSRLAGLLLLFAAALIVGCNSEKDNAWLELEEEMEKENKTCPEDLGNGLTLTSVILEDDQLVMKVDISADEEDVTPAFFRQNRELFKMGMFADLKDDADTRKMCELCVKAEVQIKMVFHFQRYGEDVQLVVPVNEIEEALQSQSSSSTMDQDSLVEELAPVVEEEETADDDAEQARIAIRTEVASLTRQLPMNIEAGLDWTDISYDGSNLIYVYTMDESNGTVNETLAGREAIMKNTMKAQFRDGDSTIKTLVELLVQANSGVIFQYVGASTGQTVSPRLSSAELAAL